MENLFELITEQGNEVENEFNIRIGIRLKMSGFEAAFPITRACQSYDALEKEIQGIIDGLNHLLTRAERMFQGSGKPTGFALDSPAEEIWVALSGMSETVFIETFNGMEEGKRREVAEYVLSKCNMFSGNGLIFSERYEEESAMMA